MIFFVPSSVASAQTHPLLRDWAAREHALRSRVEVLAESVESRVAPPMSWLAEYCDGASSEDVSGDLRAIEAWRARLPAGTAPRAIDLLARRVMRCGFSTGALLRAALLLESMYWNDVLDQSGLSVADRLGFMNVLLELAFLKEGQATLRGILEPRLREPLTGVDFLELPREGARSFLIEAARGVNLAFPGVQRALEAAHRHLGRRQGASGILGDELVSALREPRELALVHALYDRTEQVMRAGTRASPPHGLWLAWQGEAHGDVPRLLRILAAFASLRFWPIETVGMALYRRGELSVDGLRAIIEGMLLYFRVMEWNERTAILSPDRRRLVYHAALPPSFESSNWKSYHWFVNAHLGCALAREGHSEPNVVTALGQLARGYELLTLHRDLPARRGFGVESVSSPILEGWSDVDLNEAGARFGARECSVGAHSGARSPR